MEKKLIGIILVASLVVIFIAGYGNSIYSQSNQTESPDSRTSTSPAAPTQPNEALTESPNATKDAEQNSPIPDPAVPQFTLAFVNSSYTVIDPYTGVSQQVANNTVNIIVKNQPFKTIYNQRNNITTSLFYNVEFKGHYTENWTEAFSVSYSYVYSAYSDSGYSWYNYPPQSNSDYTSI